VLKTLTFVRHNAIALLALFVALGGTSYAALNIPAGSIGTRELHNGAVTNKKLANASVTPAKFGLSRHRCRCIDAMVMVTGVGG
jgi:hypothetical protein